MKYLLSFTLFVFILAGCSDFVEFKGVPIRQYGDRVIRFSSQYSSTDWAASKALGKENVYPNYGDFTNAWASLTDDSQREFLELGFDTIQTVKTIEIFETNNPGAIDTVYLRDATLKKWNKMYAKPAVANLAKKSRIFSIYFIETDYFVDAIRIAINSPNVEGWNEIDAVAITGQRKNITK
jgi:hypothetical protein